MVVETTKFNETYLLKGNAKATQDTVAYATTEIPATFEAGKDSDGNELQFYAANGTTALTETEILDALDKKQTLYKDDETTQTEKTGTAYTAGTAAKATANGTRLKL